MSINSVTPPSGIFNTLQILGANNAIAWADQIMAAATGTANANNVLEALNEKLEVSGVLGSGTSVPAHSSTSPLFFHKTDDDAFYIKGTSSYSELSDSEGFAANVILNIGRTTPTWNAVHSSTSPLIFFNTATAELWFKTGSDYRQFVGQAADMGFQPETGDTVLAGQDNVEDALKALSRYVRNLPRGGGDGDGTDDQTAAEVPTNTSSFDNNLSSSNSNVQSALNTLDDIDVPPFQNEEIAATNNLLLGAGSMHDQSFTVDQDLRTYRDTYKEQLFIEVNANVEIQQTVGNPNSYDLVLSVRDSAGANFSTPIQSDPVTLANGNGGAAATVQIRVVGLLPLNVDVGTVRVAVQTVNAGTPSGGVRNYKIEIKSDVKADEVIVKQTDLGNNLSGDSDNLEEIISEIDEIPIEVSEPMSIGWPEEPNGIDSNGTEIRRDRAIHRLVRRAIELPNVHYIARISYDSKFIGVRGDGRSEVNFTHNIYTDLSGTAIETETITAQGSTATTRTVEVDIPVNSTTGAAPTEFRVGFTVPSGQSGARLEITNYEVVIQEGVDASGFTDSRRILDNSAISLPTIADQIYRYIPPDMPAPQNAAEVPIVLTPTNPFADPNNFIGGIRIPGNVARLQGSGNYESNPDDVRSSLENIDFRLQEAYNPFQATQLLDRFVGGSPITTFTSNTANTEIYSDALDIPEELIRLGSDIALRLQLRIQTLGSDWIGNIGLTSGGTVGSSLISGADAIIVNNTAYSTGGYVSHQWVIPAATARSLSSVYVRFMRTAGTTESIFDQGFFDVIDSSASGGSSGQANTEPELIWEQGPNVNDRATATGVRNLNTGKRFSDYRMIWVWADLSGGDREAAIYSAPVILWQQIGATTGTWVMTTDNTWRAIRWKSDTSWEKVWPNGGIRKIYGW